MNDNLISSLILFKKSFHSLINQQCEKFNLTSAEHFLLGILSKEGDLHQSALAKILGCDKAHVHRTAIKLKEKGFIEFVPDEEKKTYKIHLTKQGKNVTKTFDETISMLKEVVYSGIDKSEIELVAKTIKKFAENIKLFKEKEKKDV